MKIEKVWELMCDGCGGAEHFGFRPTKKYLKDFGYIIKGNKVFCSNECVKRNFK
jgi:hypothetical protein